MSRKYYIRLAAERWNGLLEPFNDAEALEVAKAMFKVIKARRRNFQHPLVTGAGRVESISRYKLLFA